MQNTKKGQIMSLEGLAFGILIVAVVIIVGVYLITSLGTTLNSTNTNVVSAIGNTTLAFVSFATLLGLVVLVGVIGIILLMLRGGSFGGRA